MTLTGANSYTGGTTVSGGILQGNTPSLQGNILNNAVVMFNQTGSGTYAGAMSGTGGMTLQGGGVLTLTGTNTYTGATTVNASTLVVNGSLASTVTLNNGGMLGGNGTIGGAGRPTAASLAPGNSIGTLNVNGNFSPERRHLRGRGQRPGPERPHQRRRHRHHQRRARCRCWRRPGNYAHQHDLHHPQCHRRRERHLLGCDQQLRLPDAVAVLRRQQRVPDPGAAGQHAFSGFGGNTANQRAVGTALDQSFASATGDFATVIGALAGLSTHAGPGRR